MQAKHTPGPWAATLSGDARIDDRVTGANGAPVLRGSITNTADAALIAAAPDMLAALRAVADYWAGGDVPADIDAMMRAAIARATGGAA